MKIFSNLIAFFLALGVFYLIMSQRDGYKDLFPYNTILVTDSIVTDKGAIVTQRVIWKFEKAEGFILKDENLYGEVYINRDSTIEVTLQKGKIRKIMFLSKLKIHKDIWFSGELF